MMQTPNEPIAVIGSGCRFPGGANTPSKLWELLKEPKDLLSRIPKDRFNVDAFYHPDGTHHGRTNVQHSYFLSENVQAFDASFFNITPSEAECVDPQHRLLLETVYESLCAAGLKVENLQGSPTAVFVGLMCGDYADVLAYDLDSAPAYTATGSSPCILSNRVSYFFDWHGPSMTIDTACSSSLVAVHQAVQCLRSGDSKVAIAAGANLIFGPLNYIIESSLGMLSPNGRSRMWDAAADGYARGEGVACVVLKTLSQALSDGDDIECVIRETGVNQDGRSAGITMPSHVMQEKLIRDTYAKAGLDIANPRDRCQYFEAHGTGTPAGDPQEAEAISSAFFGNSARRPDEECLYVGSIKTVIGHTEGTAGIAGLLKASLALQHSTIPPNLLFENLSPRVEPFYKDLRILTAAQQWPRLEQSGPRRASVNSFGFGGTNAHAILESFDKTSDRKPPTDVTVPSLMPIVLSASSERALKATMERLLAFLTDNPNVSMQDLGWTLIENRSTLSVRRALSAQTASTARAALQLEIAAIESKQSSFVKTEHKFKIPNLLGIFTGQGAQWPAMGKSLITSIPFARHIIDDLDRSLASLPPRYRPAWTLLEQFMLDAGESNVMEATFSQPLCTAVQIVLVELLGAAGYAFKAVVGHSSGEIACAFAAGHITAAQAIRIAYLRGHITGLASSPAGVQGAMLAAGTTFADAQELCALDLFAGRMCVAASNAPDSVTLSGDIDAIEEAQAVLEDEAKFARLLKVDKAYHSHHMVPCSRTYLQALISGGCAKASSQRSSPTIWISSVYAGKQMSAADVTADYWTQNLISPVLFSQAVTTAMTDHLPFDSVVEVGCHAALKGPCLSTIQSCIAGELPYTGCMRRGEDDVESFARALGYLWEHFGSAGMDLPSFRAIISADTPPDSMAKVLPQYPWDNQKSYWVNSRSTRDFLNGEQSPHSLLGKLSSLSTASTLQWHNFVRPRDIKWLDGHQLQGQTVFPGAAYAIMAMEAAKHVAGDREIQLLEVLDLKIGKAITFDDENSLVEINLTLDLVTEPGNTESIVLRFNCDSCLAKESALSWSAGGILVLTCGPASAGVLPLAKKEPAHMAECSVDKLYDELDIIGYGYTNDFRGLTKIRRSTGRSTGTIRLAGTDESDSRLVLHPATLDVAFQAFISAYCAPGDGRLRSLHVPTSIGRIAVNPWLSAVTSASTDEVLFNAFISKDEGDSIGGEVEVFNASDRSIIVQVEGISFKPFSPPTSADDKPLFSKWVWGPLNPDPVLNDKEYRATDEDAAIACHMERMLFFYLRQFLRDFDQEDRLLAAPHTLQYVAWAEHIMELAATGQHPWYASAWDDDKITDIDKMCQRIFDRADVRLFRRVGENLLAISRQDANAIEIMNHDGLLGEFYEKCLGCPEAYHYLGELVSQLSHRYPNMNVLEIGAGTGGATKIVLPSLGESFDNFTFTDISSGFFEQAQRVFGHYEDRLDFKTLDITKKPGPQGFKEHSYDMVVAANVLHATPILADTLTNVRSLLKPGGHLLLLELTNLKSNRAGFIFGLFADWWAGQHEGRELAPFVPVERWDSLMSDNGFSSIDTRTADLDHDVFALSVFSARAMDSRTAELDAPLLTSATDSAPQIVVIGGKQDVLGGLVSSLRRTLSDRSFRIFGNLQDILDQSLKPNSTFLVLSELENELFAHLNEDKFESVKSVLFYARNVIWVTENAWTEHPHQAMLLGLLRTLRLENSDISFQSLDVDNIDALDASMLATQVVRLEAERGYRPEGILWTMEPELRLENGRLYAPRLTPDKVRNDRYNAARRSISTSANPSQATVAFRGNQTGGYFHAVKHSLLDKRVPDDQVRILVNRSSAQAIRVGNLGYFFLVDGQAIDSRAHVLALSESNASQVDVPTSRVVNIADDVNSDNFDLLAVAAELFADAVLSCAAPGSSMLVFEPYPFMLEPLLRRASQMKVEVTFAAANESHGASCPDSWLQLHEKDTVLSLAKAIPSRCSSFFDLSDAACPVSLANRLRSSLPAYCTKYKACHLYQEASFSLSVSSENLVGNLLADALNTASKQQAVSESVPATKLANQDCQIQSSTIIDWTNCNTLTTRVLPIDSADLFSREKTYLLVGLAGDLGRSLCLWMIQHGARHVVLTSRNPKVDQTWIDEMASLGAVVKVQSMNVIHRDSIISGLAEIAASMPVVGGIAFGPLVLQDALFENMDIDTMEMVVEPKVEGARHLNDLFFDQELDFFIMFSSLVMVGGNPGQSNYSAANAYMRTVAAQRRQRGLSGSCINIGAITGVGFLAKAAREEDYSISKYMFPPLAEQDLHTQFAEAVVSGRPDATDDFELMTGMPYMDPLHKEHLPFFDDPRLGRYRLPDQQLKSSAMADSRSRPVKESLAEATSKDGAFNAIRDGLTEKLRAALAIPADESVDVETPLIDQGVDSLVAVAIRTWFSKQLDLDVPVLKVLGGASINDLVDEVLDRLPQSLVPLMHSAEADKSGQPQPSVPLPTADPLSVTAVETTPGFQSTEHVSEAMFIADMSDSEPSESQSDEGSSPLHTSGQSTPPTAFSVLDNGQEKQDPFGTAALSKDLQRQEIMSFGQARFWLMRKLVEDPTTFNVTVGLWMEGYIDIQRLSNAVHAAVQRHETFRTRFFEEDGRPDRPMQGIMRTSKVRFENVPVDDKPAALQHFKRLERHLYNIESGETARVVYYHWSSTEGFLVICYHHIISDGWTYEMMFNEIDKLYRGEVLPLPPQYADYAARQRMDFETGGMDADIAYWEAQYKTLPPVLPLLPLSDTTTRSRPIGWDYHEASFRLQPMVGARIRDRSRKHKANPIHFYLAAFEVLLARLSGVDDFSIGLSDANRATLDDLATAGFFINLLPIRLQYSANETFGEAIGQARVKVREALLHAKVPFDILLQRLNVPRASTHAPVFQAGFDYRQGQAESGSLGDATLTGVELSRSRAAMDVMLEVMDDPKRDPKITFKLQSSFYAKEDVEALLRSYVNMLATFSRNPALRVEEPRLYARGDVEEAVNIGKGLVIDNVWQNTLVTRIHDQCQSVPEHIAIKSASNSLTYRELDHRINDVANILIRHGVRAGQKVISLHRATATWIYTMLGIMKIGAVYVPVDPSLPLARMSVIFDECKPAIVFTNLPANELASVRDMGYQVLNVDSISSSEINIKCVAEAEQPCAILYTSGTTGNPKGHILTHRSILNNIAGTIAMLGTVPLHVLQQSALTFDMAIWQPLLGLASGGSVSVVPQEARRDSAKISEIISKDKVSTIVATPLEYASWIQVGSENLRQATKWKHALTGGEALSHAVLQKFRSLHLPELRVFNSYGPAEISFYATAIEIDYRASDLPSRIPIGMPMPNYSVYVVDEKLRPVPIGWPGEIVIGGLGVGQGYLNRPEMTATAFIPDTLASPEQKQHGFTTLFRSGDRGRLRADGALLFDGRLDGSTQIKLRGMRIELQDIEASILAASSGQLSQAIVTTRGDGASKFLVAYVVFASSSPTTSDQEAISRTTYLRGLRNSLALPTYMRPATLIEIASLPVGRHSKVDRAALAALPLPTTSAITSQSRDTSALTAAEHALWQLWCDVLPEEALTEITPGPDTDFIEIGGNSILIVQLHAAMQSDLMGGKRMPLVQLFENTGLADMSECVRLHMEAC